METKDYCFSTDEEHYHRYDSIDKAIELFDFDDVVIGKNHIYKGESRPVNIEDICISPSDLLLDYISDMAWDLYAETSENWLEKLGNISVEDSEELNNKIRITIKKFLNEKSLLPDFDTVDNIKTITIDVEAKTSEFKWRIID